MAETAPDRSGVRRTLEYRAVEGLVPYATNARTHSPAQVAQLAKNIQRFSFTNPILLDERGGIIAGHGRLLAAQKLGMATVPCLVIASLTEDEKRGLILADNQLGLTSGWNEDLLVSELGILHENDFDLSLTGFSGDEIAALLSAPLPDGLADPDDAPAAPVHPVTEPGDVWLMKAHRLTCGDSADADTVATALNGILPNLMVTSPPDGDPHEAWTLFPGNVAYIWHAGLAAGATEAGLDACGLRAKAQIVWIKDRPARSRDRYRRQHEPCLYAVRDGAEDDPGRYAAEHEAATYATRDDAEAGWHGDRKQSTVWFIEPVKDGDGRMPVEAMRRPMLNSSAPGQAVYDPFCGTGTSIVAAEMTGRACHGIEADPAAVDVAVRRWEQFTGLEARLERDGRTFAEVAAARPFGD